MEEKELLEIPTEVGELSFEVDASLLFQLGEQLVTRRSVALAELIKNAYDADATRVTVYLENVRNPGGEIIVEDNGTGMIFEELQAYWMRIATNSKRSRTRSSKYCRTFTGAKGVGRFAARRLANKLTLLSVAERVDGAKEKLTVTFDWGLDFKDGQTLTQIPISYERTRARHEEPTGVTLYLQDVREAWDDDDVNALQRDLLSLANPFPAEENKAHSSRRLGKDKNCIIDPGFSLELEAPEFPEYEGELRDKFLTAAWGRLTGRVDENGIAHYSLEIRDPKQTTTFSPSDEDFSELGTARFKIYYYIYTSDQFEDFDFGVRDAQRMGREHGGVRIYLDGFRVFPYGDPGDDWLELDITRAGKIKLWTDFKDLSEKEIPRDRSYLRIPGNNQLFGAVDVSQAKMEITVSRERFADNEAFLKLRRFVQIGISWLTLENARVTYEDRQKRRRPQTVPQILEQTISKIASTEKIPNNIKPEIIQSLMYAKERAEEEQIDQITERSMLRVLSAAGATVLVTNHQFRSILLGVLSAHNELQEIRADVDAHALDRYDKILEQLLDWYNMSKEQLNQLAVLLGKSARERRKRLPVKKVVEQVAGTFSLYMRKYGISFENSIPVNLRTPPMFKAELGAVIQHVLANSMKAVNERNVRKIEARGGRVANGIFLMILDTGPGIPPERREVVFRPFETSSSPDPLLGVGTGLGLKVVHDILETYGGSARFVDPEGSPWKTQLELFIPHS